MRPAAYNPHHTATSKMFFSPAFEYYGGLRPLGLARDRLDACLAAKFIMPYQFLLNLEK